MNTSTYTTKFSRVKRFIPEFRSQDIVSVSQSVNPTTLKLEAARIGYGSTDVTEPAELRQIAECLLAAADLADLWNKDTGKGRDEVQI